MSSVSAACIFDAYSASSAHTDTFYIVSQIVRVRNSKRHFFSKLTFPYIIQPLRFTLQPHRPQPFISHNKAVLTVLPKIFRIFLKKPLTNTRKPCIMFTVIWVWRRLVARYLGVVEAAGSNPVTQTIMWRQKRCLLRKARLYRAFLLPKRRFFSVPKRRCKIAVFPLWIDLNSRKVNIRYARQIEIKNLSAFSITLKRRNQICYRKN